MKKQVNKTLSIILSFGLLLGSYTNAYAFGWRQQAVAVAYFVDKNNIGGNGCNDTWAGSINQPFCTITRGITALQAGDTLYVRGGLYPTFSVTKSNIIISGYNNEMPHISGGEGIKIRSASSVTVKGFEVTGAIGSSNAAILSISGNYNVIEGNKVHDNIYPSMSGIIISDGSYNKVIRNEVFNNNFSGIGIYGTSTNALTGNEIDSNKVYNNTLSGGDSDGIDIDGVNVTASFIHGNIVFGNADDGIDTWNSAGNIIVGNIVYGHNGIGDGNGIKTGAGAIGGGNLIKQNVSYNNKLSGFDSNGSGGNLFYNNVAYNNTYGFEDGMKSPSFTQPNVFINNIGYNNLTANFSASLYATVSHNNIWFSDKGGTKVLYNYNAFVSLTQFFQASGLDNPAGGNLASLQINPQFANPAAGLFDLLPSSPAINQGDPANPGQIAAVARVDIGAIEYSSGSSAAVLVNSVLPTSRNVPVGITATIFNTVINAGTTTATGVNLSMTPIPPGTFAYQQTDCATNAIIGGLNPSLDLAPGGILCYVLSFTPSATFAATNVHIRAQASNAPSTNLLSGINTWLLRASSSAGPDIIALTTTTDFHQFACSGTNAFAVALSNVGVAATGNITVSANTGSAVLPLTFLIQETNPSTGVVIGTNVLSNVSAGQNRTVAVFVTFNGCVSFDPAANRIFIEFKDANGNVVGSTSTAVSTGR